MQTYLNSDQAIIQSKEVLLLNSEEAEEIYLIDPKTLGILETYKVKNKGFASDFTRFFLG